VAAQSDDLADHVEESVAAIVKVHNDHAAAASPLQRRLDASTAFISHPLFVAGLMTAMGVWIGANLAAGDHAPDPPPFAWLEFFATVSALVLAALIVGTQRRDDRLAERRAELTLELALLNERKSAKIIALLEELRRDSPSIADREDPESAAMSTAADPQSMLDAIDERSPKPRR
jgi:uncharacterized membrane protein